MPSPTSPGRHLADAPGASKIEYTQDGSGDTGLGSAACHGRRAAKAPLDLQ